MIKDEQVDEPIRKFVREQDDIIIDKYSAGGANGELYFGTRKVLKDRVALKFYYYNSDISSHQEPLLLKEIESDNILKIYDAKIIDDQYAYFLTPEISGGDLQKFIDTNIITTKQALQITQGILKGLSELHKNDFVHRDLKPNNILIDKSNFNVYIADFGSIKKITSNSSVVASKHTFIYKPYEAIIDGKYYKQSDIYQVGIILFQLLNGSFPLAAADWLNERQRKKLDKISGQFEQWQYIEEIINQKIIKGKLLDLKSLPVYMDSSLKRIIKTATNVNINKRYANCAEFLKAIYDYLKNAVDWWSESNIIYAKKKSSFYWVYKSKKRYVLETSKDKVNWRKDNKHNGTLKSIIDRINK